MFVLTIMSALLYVSQIKQQITTLCKAAAPMTKSDGRTLLEWANNLSTSEEAQKLASRLHLLSLLFEVREIGGGMNTTR